MTGKQFKYRAVRYPWDEWFKKDQFTLIKGKDFSVQPHGIAMNVRMAAKVRGLKVSVHIHENYVQVTVTSRGEGGQGARSKDKT